MKEAWLTNASTSSLSNSAMDRLWDLWCCLSIVGIWPRFVEPNLIATRLLTLPVPNLPADLEGLRLVHFSDLHINSHLSNRFLGRLVDKIMKAKPDLIAFTGDFLCKSQLYDPERLQTFLCALDAPFGCFAVLGNHDYSEPISIHPNTGDYDVLLNDQSPLKQGFKRFFRTVFLSQKISERARAVTPHQGLVSLLQSTPFILLENETRQIPIQKSFINLSGLGEYTAGKLDTAKAFAQWDPRYPSIVLAHNPDSIPRLAAYPSALILCGHTHGSQINLPGIWQRFTTIENLHLRKGLVQVDNQRAYISSGVGSLMRFRWRAIPELLVISLQALRGRAA